MPVLETALFYAATFPISPTVFAGKFLHDKWRNRDGVFEESSFIINRGVRQGDV